MDDFFCFFCGSELDLVPPDKFAICMSTSCGAKFKVNYSKGCVRGLEIASCGKECTCE